MAAVREAVVHWVQDHSSGLAGAPGYHYDMMNDGPRNRAYWCGSIALP